MKYLKFRAWDKINLKMVKVVAISERIYGDCEVPYITVCELNEDASDMEVKVRYLYQGDFVLLQCTEVESLNPEIELYLGDIVSCFTDELSVVVNKQNAFGLDTKGVGFTPFYEIYGKCEVLGNFYENQELLNVN